MRTHVDPRTRTQVDKVPYQLSYADANDSTMLCL